LCDAPPWGDLPLLTIPDAVNSTCTVGVGFGSGYIEVYESDVNNPDLQGFWRRIRQHCWEDPMPAASH
jgi:hypothetical protein